MYGYFAQWQRDDVFTQLTGLLRHLVRQAEGRPGEPSACVLDSQTIKTSASVPRTSQGPYAGKRITGRKRHLGCQRRRRLRHRSEALIHLAMIDLMTRRLTGETTPNWCGT